MELEKRYRELTDLLVCQSHDVVIMYSQDCLFAHLVMLYSQ